MTVSIIVGIDDSPGSADALAFAWILQPVLESEVLAVHVETDGSAPPAAPPAGTRLVTVKARTVSQGLRVAAANEDAAVVIVGVSHRTGLSRLSREGGGEHLLFDAPATPVAIVPAGYAERAGNDVRVIGAGFDGGPEATEATRSAGILAGLLGATLRVYAYADAGTSGPATQARTFAGDTPRERLERGLEAVLAEVPAGVRPLGQIAAGVTRSELVQRSAEVDLLVLGTHDWGRWTRAFFGSVAVDVARGAEAPVLVLPTGSAEAFTAALLAPA